ncbi:MAG: agmatinase family protein [Bacteroidota bacterium]
MTKAEQIAQFDPNGVGHQGSLFGLPYTPETAEVVIIPVPWEVTVSYGSGTVNGPKAVLAASPQIDYYLQDIPEAWKLGIAMEAIPMALAHQNDSLRKQTQEYIAWLEAGNSPEEASERYKNLLGEVNNSSKALCDALAKKAEQYLDQGKLVGFLGGDHSTPLGLLTALAGKYEDFGILQIDAHADLRVAYEGFTYSHASIMTNALKLPSVSKLVQVGLRDYAACEQQVVASSQGRVVGFYDQTLQENRFDGMPWSKQCESIIERLPERVYVSFDIDGLDPTLCPNTGTPVPGGLSMEQAMYLIKRVVKSGRRIIGFDVSEVAPGDDEWDGNVGARVLYRLACWAGVSMGKLST